MNPPQKQSTQPQCAVIIVAWNCWDDLYRCLDALDRQTHRDFCIILMDNGEATEEQRMHVAQFDRLIYVKNQSNLGFAAANNRALDLAKNFTWVALLNPDTIPAPNWLEKMLIATCKFPQQVAFGCRIKQARNPELLDGEGDCYHVSGFAWRKGMGLPAEGGTDEPREAFSLCAAAALYRTDILMQMGGFDEDFFCYMEDVDLNFRLRLAGYRCLIVPDADVLHVGSSTTGKRSPFYIYYGQRNLIWTYVKNMPGALFWLFLPLHFLLNIAGVLRYGLTGQLRHVVRAKHDALKSLPQVWQKRGEIQKNRIATPTDILKVLNKCPIPGLGRALNSFWK